MSEDRDFGEQLHYLLDQGLTDEEVLEHLDPGTGPTDLVAFIRISREKAAEKKKRHIEEIPCIQIAAKDWLSRKDVREWIDCPDNNVPRLWCDDVFTIYDGGDGPHSPTASPDNAMPDWLWTEIENILEERGLDYVVVRLMNTDPEEGGDA